MWIYAIRNKKNNKVYIGQTSRKNFEIRLKFHINNLRLNKHINPHLQHAWNKDGEEKFEYFMVCSATDNDELDLLEMILIDGFRPNVYNILDGGEGYEMMSQMSIIRWKNPKHKKWRFETNKEIWGDPVKKKRMLSGIMKYAYDSKTKSKWGKINWKSPEYRKKFEKNYGFVKSPKGKIFEVIGLRKFCRKHKLDTKCLSNLCNGKDKQYKGWTKYDR